MGIPVPWIVGFLAFYFFPMIASLGFTFTDLQLTQPDKVSFVGLDNYRTLFKDAYVGKSLRVTFSYMLLALPLAHHSACAGDTAQFQAAVGQEAVPDLFYMPYMVPVVSLCISTTAI